MFSFSDSKLKMSLEFLKFGVSAILTMFAGSHTIYMIYRPMDDFNEFVQQAELMRKYKREQLQIKNKT